MCNVYKNNLNLDDAKVKLFYRTKKFRHFANNQLKNILYDRKEEYKLHV